MKIESLSDTTRRDWLQLSRTENVGPITFRQLLRRFGSVKSALDALPSLAARGGAKNFKPANLRDIDEELNYLTKMKGRFIALCEPDYPESLRSCEDAPPIIAVLGHPSLLQKRIVGIVGARNASLNGRKMAEKLATDLGKQDFVIASGLARGIDTAAHTATLTSGTIAVLAGGVDTVYPEENRALYNKIIETGVIVSDQPCKSEPRAQLFPRRNRIISGLSLGVIVVEAAKKSGSLITARYALDQGREVFAVPGSPLDPRAGGTNDLLRQGAVLTESAEDVTRHIYTIPRQLAETGDQSLINDTKSSPETISEALITQAREKILENLSPCPVTVDELLRECQFSLPVVLTVLLELELAGRLERQAGNRVSLLG